MLDWGLDIMQLKICSLCKEEKEVSEFHKNKSNKTGFNSRCKECIKEYNQKPEVKERRIKYAKEYRQRPEVKEQGRKYRKEYRQRPEIIERDKKYRRSPEVKERNRDYARSEKGKKHKKEYYHRPEVAKRRREYKKEYRRGSVSYNLYKEQLFFDECRSHPEDSEILQVKCIYCSQWFTPNAIQVDNRSQYSKGNRFHESNFYCSDGCKKSCPIYDQRVRPKTSKQATSREVQADLRQLVLTRDQWTCICCQAGVEKELHCHHLEGVELNPVLSADLDMCVTLCKDCHRAAHSEKNCGYNDLKRKPC